MITVYSPIQSNRFYYAVKLVLNEVGGQKFKICHHKSELKADDFIINYSGEIIENSFQIHPYGLLSEKDYRKFDVSFDYGGEEKLKLFLTEFDHLGYDVFSASFFLASRLEEYWKFEEDKHGRYQSTNSVMYKLGVLHLPLINIWTKALLQKMSSFFNEKFELKSKFQIINTIDVDNAWAYKNKGFFRASGGLGKALVKGKFVEVNERIKTFLFNKKDPYDTYQYIQQTCKKYNVKSIYFFLLADRANFDKNVPYKNKEMIELIKNINLNHQVGIHPSYQSFLHSDLIKKEKKRLENIVNSPIIKSRKHFLKLAIPETYRNLVKVGITEDYTMGYADNVGFRAGICTPFTFFDIIDDKELPLKVYPFAYMDGTWNQYLKLTPEKAIQKVTQLKEGVKSVEGIFIGIWHNETLNDKGIWKDWKEVYEAGLFSS